MARILVVDDSEQTRVHLQDMLERDGHIVWLYDCGRGAVSAARQFEPDLILLDVVMPDLHGPEVAAKLRADPDLKHTPVVYITGIIDPDEEGCLTDTMGKSHILSKPIRLPELRECLQRHLKLQPPA